MESYRFSTTLPVLPTLASVDEASKTCVYILGAGCSFNEQHGYPLAAQFVPALNSYAAKISGVAECQRIRIAVEETATLLTQCQSGPCHASTIDQLISLILNHRCDAQIRALRPSSSADAVALTYDAVRKAKIATAACFLEMEKAVRLQHMNKYKNFIQRKVLNETGASIPCQTRLQKSSARVLNFNYDRLFELAFFAGLSDANLNRFNPYQAEALNSGLSAFGEVVDVQRDRFCFLKLHGSVGMRCTEDPFGQNVYFVGNIADWKEQAITDELFFPEKQTAQFPVDPLIVFPYEKDYVVSGRSNKLPFRNYIERIWAHATHVLQEASEIWIIGYSFDPNDCEYLIERLRPAKCRRLVIQNLPSECERIFALLTIDYELKIPVEKYP